MQVIRTLKIIDNEPGVHYTREEGHKKESCILDVESVLEEFRSIADKKVVGPLPSLAGTVYMSSLGPEMTAYLVKLPARTRKIGYEQNLLWDSSYFKDHPFNKLFKKSKKGNLRFILDFEVYYPNLLCLVKVLNKKGKKPVISHFELVTTDSMTTMVNDRTKLFWYPFGNVHGSYKVCTGDVSKILNTDLYTWLEIFFEGSASNEDLTCHNREYMNPDEAKANTEYFEKKFGVSFEEATAYVKELDAAEFRNRTGCEVGQMTTVTNEIKSRLTGSQSVLGNLVKAERDSFEDILKPVVHGGVKCAKTFFEHFCRR